MPLSTWCTMKRHSKLQKRQKRRQCHWKMFGAAVLLCSLPTCRAALPKRDKPQSLSISSSKTRAALYADTGSDLWNKSTRMANQPHAAQYLLSNDSTDFGNRLLQELSTDESISPKTTSQEHPLESLLLYGVLTLALTSALLTPNIFVTSLYTMVSSVALLVPWLYMARTNLFSKETVLLGITYFMQLAPQRDGVLFQRVVPLMSKLLKQMVWAEAWSRVWHIAGKSISTFFHSISLHETTTTTTQQEESQWILPQVFHTLHEFVDTSIRKGTTKAVTKTLERNAQAAIETTLESVALFVEKAVVPIVLLPFQGVLSRSVGKQCCSV